jgi:broad specificity phosphatase PhoE
MPHLYLVRHGQPDFAGDYDSVTSLGVRQSVWLGEHFAARGLRFARAVSGSLRRQAHTLEAIMGRLPAAPPMRVDSRLNEYDAASVLAAFGGGDEPGLRAAGDRRSYFAALRAALRAWASDAEMPGGGETWRAFGERITAAAREAGVGLERSDAVLLVTSGGVIGRLVADALGAGADAAIELNLQTRNTGITELVQGRSISRLLSFNAVPHLELPERAHAVTHS